MSETLHALLFDVATFALMASLVMHMSRGSLKIVSRPVMRWMAHGLMAVSLFLGLLLNANTLGWLSPGPVAVAEIASDVPVAASAADPADPVEVGPAGARAQLLLEQYKRQQAEKGL